MRNLKKLLAVIVSICVLATFTVPAFAADATLAADTQTCANIGVIVGSGSGVTAEYAATAPTRIQAAVMLLNLTGNIEAAKAFTGTDNFADADKASWAKPLMAFLKAHPELGFVGDGTNFAPTDKITAQQYYKVLLTALGYAIPGDYAYADTLTFAKDTVKLALAGNVADFTIDSLATATVEALKATVKGGTKTLAATLVDAGKLDKAAAQAAGLYYIPKALDLGAVNAVTNTRVNISLGTAAVQADLDAVTITAKDSADKALEIKSATLSADGKTIKVITAAQTEYIVYTLTIGSVNKTFVGIPADTGKPTVDNIVSSDGNVVTVTFNEDVDEVSAANIANYTVAGLPILKATVDGAVVTLSTATQTVGTIYTLVSQNVTDLAGNVMDKNESLFGGTPLDTDKVGLVTATATGNTEVSLDFNDTLDTVSAQDITNYSIEGLTILKATQDADDKSLVTLTTSAQTVGTIYTLVIKATLKDKVGNAFDTDTDEVLFGGMPADTDKPTIASAVSVGGNKVDVTFTDLKLDEASAENIANYAIADLTVLKAEMNGLVVTLTTSTQVVGKLYTLKTTGVKDASGNVLDGTVESIFGGTELDTAGPVIVSVTAANKKVTIVFDEKVDEASAEVPSNYAFDGSLGYPTKAVRDTDLDSTGKTVVLTTKDQTSAKVYNVVVSNVKDVNGNVIKTADDASKMPFVGVSSTTSVGPKLVGVVSVNKNTIDLIFDQEIADAGNGVVAMTLAILNSDGTAYTYGTTGLTNANIVALRQADKKTVRVNFGTAVKANEAVFANLVYKVNVTAVANTDGLAIQTGDDSYHIKAFAGNASDDAKPFVSAIVPVNSSTLDVYFSEPVTNVDAADFDVIRTDGTVITTDVASVFADSTAVLTTDRVEKVRMYLSGDVLVAGKVYKLKATSAGINDAAGFDVLKENTDDNLTYDVSFAGVATANAAPKISAVIPVDKWNFDIVFSEPVVNATAAAYTVVKTSGTGADLNLAGATYAASSDKTKVSVHLSSATVALVAGTVYKLTYTPGTIADLQGVAYDTATGANLVNFGGVNATNAAPSIAAVSIDADNDTITIVFSETVTITGLNVNFFTITGAGYLAGADSATFDGDKTVTYNLANDLTAAQIATIKVSANGVAGIHDINLQASGTDAVSFGTH